jgi:phage-related protein
MWALIVVTVATTPYLNPVIPQPKYEVIGTYDTMQHCQDDEFLYSGAGYKGRRWTVPYTYDKRTQCVRVPNQ